MTKDELILNIYANLLANELSAVNARGHGFGYPADKNERLLYVAKQSVEQISPRLEPLYEVSITTSTNTTNSLS